MEADDVNIASWLPRRQLPRPPTFIVDRYEEVAHRVDHCHQTANLDCMIGLIDQYLLLGGCGEGVDIGDNDGHDEVDHDQGAEDDETDQESHGEDKRQDVLVLGVIVQGVKLKLPQNHDYDF